MIFHCGIFPISANQIKRVKIKIKEEGGGGTGIT